MILLTDVILLLFLFKNTFNRDLQTDYPNLNDIPIWKMTILTGLAHVYISY